MKINCKISEENMIFKYGEEEGKIKYQKWKDTCSHDLEFYKNKYGEEEGKKRHDNIRRKSAVTEENMILKYGEEEGKIKYQNWKDKCSHGIEFYKNKYGEEEGTKRYENYVKKLSNSNVLGRASKESMLVFSKILETPLIKEKAYYGYGDNVEYFLRDDNGKIFFYDFVLTDSKIIIEYNGVHIHANKNWEKEKLMLWKHAYTKETSSVVIKNDNYKLDLAKKKGFNVLVLWSDDTIEYNIEKCLKFIKEII